MVLFYLPPNRAISKTFKTCKRKLARLHIARKEGDSTEVEKVFGVNAGKAWGVLKSKGPLTAEALAKETKLSLNDVFGALGWLGREGKIIIMKDATGTVYKLK